MTKTIKNPYDKSGRLQDVLAAVSALATYKYYKLSFEKAFERISNSRGDIKRWEAVFAEHPEFFRIESDKREVSLVIRRQFQKRWNVDMQTIITDADFRQLSTEQKKRISRKPLSPDQTLALLQLAEKLNEAALKSKQDRRWWVEHFGSVLGIVIGAAVALAAVYFKHKLGP